MGNTNCIFSIIDKNGKQKAFSSDWLLDAYIKENHSGFVIDEIDKTLSVDLQKIAIDVIEEIKIDHDAASMEVTRVGSNPDELETYKTIPHSMGITKFIGLAGNLKDINKGIITPFDLKAWKRDQIQRNIKKGMTEQEAIDLVTKVEESWPFFTKLGSYLHGIIEQVIKNMNDGTEIDFTVIPNYTTYKDVVDDVLEDFIKDVRKYINDLKIKHGQNSKFYVELGIKSKELSPELKKVLEKNHDVTSLNGFIDLLVVDDFGGVHIYDWKTSNKSVGEWKNLLNKTIGKKEYDSTKKLTIENQLTYYKVMLQQYNLNVVSVNVVPIKFHSTFEEDGATLKSLDRIEFENTITNPEKTNLGGKWYMLAKQYLPTYKEYTSTASLVDSFEQFDKLFPAHTASRQVKHFKATYEYYRNNDKFVKKVDKSSYLYTTYGYRYQFFESNLKNGKNVYAATEEELEKKIKDYIDRLNNEKENDLTDFAQSLQSAIDGQLSDPRQISDIVNENKKEWVYNMFKKYIVEKWNFINNQELISSGIFVFRKGDQSEVIILTNKPLMTRNKLSKGHSILGDFKKDEEVDTTEDMMAFNANLEIMKGMAFISNNLDLFEGTKINEIKPVNLWHNTTHFELNSTIYSNWDRLMMHHKMKNTIPNSLFYDDASATINIADSLHRSADMKNIDFDIVESAIDTENLRAWIENRMEVMRSKYAKLNDPSTFNTNDEIWQVYTNLRKALLYASGIKIYNELDVGNWFNKGVAGLYVSNFNFSPSANARQLGVLFHQYTTAVKKFVNDRHFPWNQKLQDFFTEMNRSRLTGGEANYFLTWFRRDANGEIDGSLKLKNPNDPEFDNAPAAKAALQHFLTEINNWRFDYNEDKIQSAIEDDSYYEVPLIPANTMRQIKRGGIKNYFKKKWNEAKNLSEDIMSTDVELKQEFNKAQDRLYNRFKVTSEQRENMISQYGSGFFETDLEEVFNTVLLTTAKESTSVRFIKLMEGLKYALMYNQAMSKNEMKNIIDFIDKSLKKKLYGESIIEKELQGLHAALNIIKMGTTKLTLALNGKSFGREMLQGWYTGLSRAVGGSMQGITKESYVKGFAYVLQHSGKNYSNVSLVQQLNAEYGMANYGLNEIVSQKRNNPWGIRNLSDNTLFFTSTGPDFQHRNAILISKMMGDGCWEAHGLDAEGQLKYDWKKDSRYAVYISGDTNHKDYFYQRAEYLERLDQFNLDGYTNEDGNMLQEGDDLPKAYTDIESLSIKNFSEFLYGHYDAETRALVNDTFIGSLMMHFKTYIIAKLEQNLIKPGKYNIKKRVKQIDPETGEEIWRVATYPHRDENGKWYGMPTHEFMLKSQVPQSKLDEKLAQPFYKMEGIAMEGMVYTMIDYLKAIKNPREFKKLWANELKRSNFIHFMNDMVIMTLLGILFTAILGSYEEIKDAGWVRQMSYGILLGSTQDGPINEVISAMLSDLNPPSKVAVERIYNTSLSVITGDQRLVDATVNTVGFLKETRGLVREW